MKDGAPLNACKPATVHTKNQNIKNLIKAKRLRPPPPDEASQPIRDQWHGVAYTTAETPLSLRRSLRVRCLSHYAVWPNSAICWSVRVSTVGRTDWHFPGDDLPEISNGSIGFFHLSHLRFLVNCHRVNCQSVRLSVDFRAGGQGPGPWAMGTAGLIYLR